MMNTVLPVEQSTVVSYGLFHIKHKEKKGKNHRRLLTHDCYSQHKSQRRKREYFKNIDFKNFGLDLIIYFIINLSSKFAIHLIFTGTKSFVQSLIVRTSLYLLIQTAPWLVLAKLTRDLVLVNVYWSLDNSQLTIRWN